MSELRELAMLRHYNKRMGAALIVDFDNTLYRTFRNFSPKKACSQKILDEVLIKDKLQFKELLHLKHYYLTKFLITGRDVSHINRIRDLITSANGYFDDYRAMEWSKHNHIKDRKLLFEKYWNYKWNHICQIHDYFLKGAVVIDDDIVIITMCNFFNIPNVLVDLRNKIYKINHNGNISIEYNISQTSYLLEFISKFIP